MRPPSPSVSPLPSFASRPDFVARPVSFVDMARSLWSWVTGRKPTTRERMLEARLVDALAEELAVDEGALAAVDRESAPNEEGEKRHVRRRAGGAGASVRKALRRA
jgi:hypothetical protein